MYHPNNAKNEKIKLMITAYGYRKWLYETYQRTKRGGKECPCCDAMAQNGVFMACKSCFKIPCVSCMDHQEECGDQDCRFCEEKWVHDFMEERGCTQVQAQNYYQNKKTYSLDICDYALANKMGAFMAKRVLAKKKREN